MSGDLERLGFPVVEIPATSGSTAEDVVRFLVGHLVQSGRLAAEHAERVAGQVLHRESLGSTSLGRGIALPHAKSDVVAEVLGAAGRLAQPLTWPGALDDVPVRLVILLVTPASDPGTCARALGEVLRRLADDSGTA